MRTASGMAAAAGAASLPFGAAVGWLRWRGYYLPDARVGWMVFWLCSALLVYLLHAVQPDEPNGDRQSGWHCVSTRQRPLHGLALPLVESCLLCIVGALGELCLRLPPAGAALWSGGTAAALVWLLLCLLALVCRWEEH